MVQPNDSGRRQTIGLGGLLRDWREQAGLTQEQLAKRAGVGARTIRALESGAARPRAATLRLLSDALGLDGPARARLHAATRQPHRARRLAPPATAGGPPAGVVVPAQLPADVAGFTGRQEQLRQLDALLAHHGDRQQGRAVVISAIAGTAGVGKTALAIRWAHRVCQRLADGQLYVNLHGFAPSAPLSPAQALARLLVALRVEPDRIPVDVDEAAGLYRSLLADRRMLVVLDNARDAEQVRPLIPGAPGCVVVVTSRDQLGGLVASHGAVRLIVDVLTPGEAVGLLAHTLGPERVDAEPQAATALAAVCGYLPLALRIAAANLTAQPDQPLAGFVARLRSGDRLAELSVDGDPHAAVRAAFDRSYAVLEPDARRLFCLLGLVPGPDFTTEAAAALAETPVGQAGWGLQRLADAHLLERRGPGRFGFHDLLRLYARQRAEQDDSQADRRQALERLLGWYLHTADVADRLLYPEMLRLPVPPVEDGQSVTVLDDRMDALGWLDVERANLVAAVQHAAAHGPRPVAWLLGDALRGYFWDHRHMLDWLTVAQAGLSAAEADGDPQAQAAAYRTLGAANRCRGQYVQAVGQFSSALRLAREAGWVDGEANALTGLGIVHTEMGQLQQAADHYAKALALCQRTGQMAGQAVIMANLAEVLGQMGRLSQAIVHANQCLSLCREIGAPGVQTAVLANLGKAYCDLGRLNEAAACLDRAVSLAREHGNRYDEAAILHALAAARRDAGQLARALELAKAAVELAHDIGDPRVEGDALNTLGSIEACLGRHQQAAERHAQALGLVRQARSRYPEVEALVGLAVTAHQQGRHAQALQHAGQAHILACQSGFRILEGRAHAALAAANLDLGHDDQAVAHTRQAVAIFGETGHRLGHARALVKLGHVLDRAGDGSAARSCWQEALALFEDVGAPEVDEVLALLDAGGAAV
jgi:tetratricopeptide (TPR) repeat protein/DNA-binding XRE family transcriptional regulator